MDEQVKPAEWVLVPREATEEMLDAYWHSTGESREMRSRIHARGQRIYADFLAASPSPEGTRERGELANLISALEDARASASRKGNRWRRISDETLRQVILALALALPPVPGVDREVVERLKNDLAQGWISNARTAADIRAILARVTTP